MPTPQALKDCLRRNENFTGEVFFDKDLQIETLVIGDEFETVLASYDLEEVVRFIAKFNVRVIQDSCVDTVLFKFDITRTEAFKNLQAMNLAEDVFYKRSVKVNSASAIYALVEVQRVFKEYPNVLWNHVYANRLEDLESISAQMDAVGLQHTRVIMEAPLKSKSQASESEEKGLSAEEVDLGFRAASETLEQQQQNLLVTLWLIAFAILEINQFCISKAGRDKKHPCYELMMSEPTSPKFNAYIKSTVTNQV